MYRISRVQSQSHLQLFSSSNACFTSAPAGIKSPSIATVSMLPPSVQNNFFPQWADLAVRVEDHHAHIFQAIKACATAAPVSPEVAVRMVTGLSPLMCVSICAIKASAKVFKCKRRAVEQFQTTDICGNLSNRCRKSKCSTRVFPEFPEGSHQ